MTTIDLTHAEIYAILDAAKETCPVQFVAEVYGWKAINEMIRAGLIAIDHAAYGDFLKLTI